MTDWDKQVKALIVEFSKLGFDLETDQLGQIIIYTGMKFNDDDQIVPMEDEE